MALAAVPFPHWHPHLDVWVLIGGLGLLYALAVPPERARRPGESVVGRRHVTCFAAALGVMWLASDWPMHDVAEGYLYSAHMVQHMLLTLVVALLLLAGTPAWMARTLLGRGALLNITRSLSRPVTGLIQFNLVLVLSHWPVVVEATVRYHPLHFVAHAVIVASALVLWLPVASPLRDEIPRLAPPAQMLYLFLQTIIPTVPASFLTFGRTPLYPIYETFPRLWGIEAVDDQQVAGLIMKIGAGTFLWAVIITIFFRWYAREEAKPKDVLLWDDVERELRRLERPGRPR